MSMILVVLFGVAALVADGGLIFLNKRAMQNAVDASALAAVQELPLTKQKFDQDLKRTGDKACEYTEVITDSNTIFNRVTGMTVNNCQDKSYQTATGTGSCPAASKTIGVLVCQTNTPYDSVRVFGSKNYSSIFGYVIGLLSGSTVTPSVTIEASATAMIGSLTGLCTFPIFQAQDLLEASGIWNPDGLGNYVEYHKATILKTSLGNVAGNFLALQVNGSSSKDLWRDTVQSGPGCSGTTYGTATTATGNFEGPFNDAFEPDKGRSVLWNDPLSKGYCPDIVPTIDESGIAVHAVGHPLAGQQLTPENCYRMIKFPMLMGNAADLNGTNEVVIRGFLSFYISNWCGPKSDPYTGEPPAANNQTCPANPDTGQAVLGSGELWGYYLRYEAVSDLPITAYDGLGTKVVALID
ncbi:MAG: pilus assembly protein [Chloroflexia bacterium]|nr:pilus assembly protein [Chloroflexia bacterium]